MELFVSVNDILRICRHDKIPVWELMLRQEQLVSECSREQVYLDLESKLQVMEAAVKRGLAGVRSYSGLSGGAAKLMSSYKSSSTTIASPLFIDLMSYALAINEVNAAMGIICATPTAGSAGVVPAVLLAYREHLQLDREAQLNFLLTAGAFGMSIGNQASISGAEGGCQAEVGSASAMAAAALCWAAGGCPEQSADALAMALMNTLGLVCDPVAGLVEIPCIKRNVMGASNALTACEMSLAGIKSEIPADEVIAAMGKVGRLLPDSLRETAQGGLAVTPTALRYTKNLRRKKSKLLASDS